MRSFSSFCAAFASLIIYVSVAGCAKESHEQLTLISHQSAAGHDHTAHDHASHEHASHEHASHEHASHEHAGLDDSVHSHASEGPHGGELIELGNGDYHAELVHVEATHTVSVYLLDGNGSEVVNATDRELTFNLIVDGHATQFVLRAVAPNAAGQASHYELSDERLCESLDRPKTHGRFNVNIDGKHYLGKIDGHTHSDHIY